MSNGLFYLTGDLAFWIFGLVIVGFLTFAIVAARLFSAKKPNKIKNQTYECGQDPFSEVKDHKFLGIARYFGYAVLFFALDAFAWVILTAALSVSLNVVSIATVSIYLVVVLTGVFYFIAELRKTVS